jgi:hypothetical protein
MRAHHKTIKLLPDSELSLTLKEALASGEPLVVDTGEGLYTLFVIQSEPEQDIFAHYDPKAAIASLQALDDALAGVDRDQLLRDLRAQRNQASLGRPA